MSITIKGVECPKCAFRKATLGYTFGKGEDDFRCNRCGYSVRSWINKEESKLPDKVIWKFEEKGGNGIYHCYQKGAHGAEGGPVDEEIIESMKGNLDNLGIAWYSFQKDGKWFIQDLIRNEIAPYPGSDDDDLW